MNSVPNMAAAYARQLHTKLLERILTDREDAWHSLVFRLQEAVLAGAPIRDIQEMLTDLVRLANRTE